jgi:hypothetical protein
VRPGLVFDEQNQTAIGAITRSLDGIPLAVELAAARVTSLSPFIKELQLLGWGGAMKPPATSPQPRTDTRRRST